MAAFFGKTGLDRRQGNTMTVIEPHPPFQAVGFHGPECELTRETPRYFDGCNILI